MAFTQTTTRRLTALTGAFAVGLGAFGAHGLETFLEQHGHNGTWETAVLYHLVHAVVLLVLVMRGLGSSLAWRLFFAGIILFSGSLYLLSLTRIGWLGAITPVGGLLLLAGWLSLFRSDFIDC